MIEVGRYLEKFHADIARSQLEASGIWAEIMTDNEGGMVPHLSFVTGVRLMVREEDETTARELLAAFDEQPPKVDSSEEGSDLSGEEADIKKKVQAALTAAVLGLVLLPIVANIWSMAQLHQLPSLRSLTADLRAKVIPAMTLNFLVLLTVVILIFSVLH